MAKAPKLKVFCTPVGFYDALVAAPSQKAALKAWGTTTDLFAAGRASVVEDPALQAEALARPGEVVKRPRGDEAAMLGPEPGPAPERGKAERPKPKLRLVKPEPPDRSELDAAERAVADAERELAIGLEDIAEKRAELDRRERELRGEAEARLKGLRAARDRAEKVFRRASSAYDAARHG